MNKVLQKEFIIMTNEEPICYYYARYYKIICFISDLASHIKKTNSLLCRIFVLFAGLQLLSVPHRHRAPCKIQLCRWSFNFRSATCAFCKCVYRPHCLYRKKTCSWDLFLKCLPRVAHIPLLSIFCWHFVSGCLPEGKCSNWSICCLKVCFFFLYLKKVIKLRCPN